MKPLNIQLWVGKRSANAGGGIYVYDVEMESTKPNAIYLFDTYRNTMQQFGRLNLREAFETIKNTDLQISVIKQYVAWITTSGEEFANIHNIDTTSSNYKEHVQRLVEQCQNLKNPTYTVRQRSTICHSCHAAINNQSGIECKKCHWIVCPHCGACGCGFTRDDW